MKVALYIEDGLEQIVLTPQSETERAILGKLHDDTRTLSIYRGEFYGCQGGWMRHGRTLHGTRDETDKSSIIVLRQASPTP